MMNAIKYMEELEQKGFTNEQAKTSVNLWIELMNENLASKHDLREVKLDIEHKIREMESRLTIKLGGIVATALGLMALIQK